MPIDARHYRTEERLRTGLVVVIRAVLSDDRARLAKAFANLERESVYTRFFSYKNELTDAELARIDAMDFVSEVMLVTTVPAGDDETIIASARYIALDGPPPRVAEVAFAVEEDYQGLGIAGRMLVHLVAIARTMGIQRFEADVLPENKAMIAVFLRAGVPVSQRREPGVVHVTLDLTPA